MLQLSVFLGITWGCNEEKEKLSAALLRLLRVYLVSQELQWFFSRLIMTHYPIKSSQLLECFCLKYSGNYRQEEERRRREEEMRRQQEEMMRRQQEGFKGTFPDAVYLMYP